MLKIEKKLIEFIERYIFIFQLALVSVLALYIRRSLIWWNPGNIGAYFDYHVNCVQSYMSYFLVRGVQVFPMLPVHSIKWLSVLGDFGTAILCMILVKQENKENKLLQVLSYTVCLLSPVLFLRGAAWAQIDSIAVFLFLVGKLLFGQDKRKTASIFLLFSILLYPCMIIFYFWFLWEQRDKEKNRNLGAVALGLIVLCILCCGMAALSAGKSFVQGLQNSISWLIYDPVTGEKFASLPEWTIGILTTLGLPGSVISGLAVVRHHKISCFAVLTTHFLLIVLYGSRMF